MYVSQNWPQSTIPKSEKPNLRVATTRRLKKSPKISQKEGDRGRKVPNFKIINHQNIQKGKSSQIKEERNIPEHRELKWLELGGKKSEKNGGNGRKEEGKKKRYFKKHP